MDAVGLFNHLQTVESNYLKACYHFGNFYEAFKRLSELRPSGSGTSVLPAIVVEELSKHQGHFSISYAGGKHHVQLVPALASDGEPVGMVRTLTVCSISNNVGEPVERFCIDKHGVTSLHSTDGARMAIPDQVGPIASTLLLSLLPVAQQPSA